MTLGSVRVPLDVREPTLIHNFNKERICQMAKILFQGDPPMMDFSLIKLTGGENLIDNHNNAIFSLGSGELTKLITDAGESLRNTLNATLATMKPNQSIRIQILVHGHVGFNFMPPGGQYYQGPGFAEKTRFIVSPEHSPGNVITAQAKNINQEGLVEEVKTIIITGSNCVDAPNNSGIKHATLRDNEDVGNDDPTGKDIIAK